MRCLRWHHLYGCLSDEEGRLTDSFRIGNVLLRKLNPYLETIAPPRLRPGGRFNSTGSGGPFISGFNLIIAFLLCRKAMLPDGFQALRI